MQLLGFGIDSNGITLLVSDGEEEIFVVGVEENKARRSLVLVILLS
jgi:hypothetical protein